MVEATRHGPAVSQEPSLPAPGRSGPLPLRAYGRWHLSALAGLLLYALVQSGLWNGDLGHRTYLGPDVAMCAWLQTTVSGNLLRHPWRPFEGNVYHPQPHPVVYANAQLGPALLVAPLRLFTANPVLLQNAGTLLTLLAASYTLFLLAWWLWGDPGAALVPALAVTYAAHQTHHLVHLNMLAIFGFPLLLLGLLQLLERPRLGAVLLAAGGFSVQLLSCAYYGIGAALLALVVGAWGLGRLHRARSFGHVLAAAALAGLVCWPYLGAFLGASRMSWAEGGAAAGGVALRLPHDLVRTGAWLWSGVLPGRGDSAFAGFAVLALAGWGAYRGFRHAYVRLLVLVAGVFLVLSLGHELKIGGFTQSLPYAWLERALPLLGAGRHPVSLVVVYLVPMGLLAALGARLSGATRGPARLALLLAVVAAEVFTPPPRRSPRGELPGVYTAVAQLQPSGAILELPFDREEQQWWASVHGLKTASGFLPHAPREWLTVTQWIKEDWKATPPRDVSDRRSVIYLQARFPVRYLVAHPDTSPAWIRNIEATPGVFERVGEVDGARIYRVSRSGRGRRLRRDFRSEELAGGLDLIVSGPAGHTLKVTEDGSERARLELSGRPDRLRLRLRARGARRVVSFELVAEPEAEFALLEIGPATAGVGAAAARRGPGPAGNGAPGSDELPATRMDPSVRSTVLGMRRERKKLG